MGFTRALLTVGWRGDDALWDTLGLVPSLNRFAVIQAHQTRGNIKVHFGGSIVPYTRVNSPVGLITPSAGWASEREILGKFYHVFFHSAIVY